MIKAIIFDFYGVIRSDEYSDWLSLHGLERDAEFKNVSSNLDMGITTVDQFFESLSKLSNIPVENIRQEFLDQVSLNKKLIALILSLKDKYKIGLLSNASSTRLRDELKNAGIAKLFDEVVISSDVGLIKPSTGIFEHALNKLGVQANDTVFIDDNQGFVEAARKLGLEAIVYEGVDSLINSLKQIGIIDN